MSLDQPEQAQSDTVWKWRQAASSIVVGITSLCIGYVGVWIPIVVNAYLFPGIPWDVVPGAAFLVAFWKWGGGVKWIRQAPRRSDFIQPLRSLTRQRVARIGLAAALGVIALRLFGGLLTKTFVGVEEYSAGTDSLSFWFSLPTIDAMYTMVVAPAVVEELAFRGTMRAGLERTHSVFVSILVTSLLFALLHSWVETPVIVYFAMGVLLALLAVASRSVVPAVLAHAGYNILWLYEGHAGSQFELSKNEAVFAIALLTVAIAALLTGNREGSTPAQTDG